ncbi:glycosyl hydrolase family 95 catalytic domain-containing protein [Aquibacillus kalidii]|uniref:glycosyl hydrolase family 95 catalytic domain-containing protein n=1 Tax=Aquibacillus kalidii TaxID=2762597 RepID=UPI00164536CB|nr:glycoside hydrolase N-terminal domain-containing protein [Aquibacillus kalidii]
MNTFETSFPLRGAWNKNYGNTWEEALVSGNGRQGVMVLGNPSNETIIGNHARLYLPTGTNNSLPNMAPYLDQFRRIIKEKGYEQAVEFYYNKALELGYSGLQMSDPFHPGFHLHINSSFGKVKNYRRSVNFDSGEIQVSFLDGSGNWHTRKTFVSRADDIIVHSIQNEHSDVTCKLDIEDYKHELINHEREIGESFVGLTNKYVLGPGGFQVAIKIVAPGGTVKVENNQILIEHAKQLLLIMKIVPFKTEKLLSINQIIAELETVLSSYDALMERHLGLHQALFERVRLNLSTDTERLRSTEDLFAETKKTEKLPFALIEKMYDAGRYMYICSAGELTPNLQGIWTGTFKPAWSGDYTFDTNVQLSIASALSCGMNDGLKGLFRLINELLPGFRDNARNYYGARGIMAPVHASNSGQHFHWNSEWPLHLWTCGAGWLGHWFYQYYLFTGDKQFLEEQTIPYLMECVQFYEDFLIEDPDGKYRFTPSYSAENGCGDNATQDIAVAREVLQNLISSCRELKVHHSEIKKWEDMLVKLPDYMINQEGAIQEWAINGKEENYNHRHFSHLYSIFQSREFNEESEPRLWEASKVALNKRLEAWLRSEDADTSSTHGRMHAALCATQFNDSKLVYEILQMMVVKESIFPSMITSHYNDRHLFNVDGNGAIPQVINEMIIDGVPGEIILLRALPTHIPKGRLEGVRVPNQIVIDKVEWDLTNKKVDISLTSFIDQEIRIKLPNFRQCIIKESTRCFTSEVEGELLLKVSKDTRAELVFQL